MITRQKIDSYYNPMYGDISVFLFFFLLRDRNCCINIVSRDISSNRYGRIITRHCFVCRGSFEKKSELRLISVSGFATHALCIYVDKSND